jgi:hypothetical protein
MLLFCQTLQRTTDSEICLWAYSTSLFHGIATFQYLDAPNFCQNYSPFPWSCYLSKFRCLKFLPKLFLFLWGVINLSRREIYNLLGVAVQEIGSHFGNLCSALQLLLSFVMLVVGSRGKGVVAVKIIRLYCCRVHINYNYACPHKRLLQDTCLCLSIVVTHIMMSRQGTHKF